MTSGRITIIGAGNAGAAAAADLTLAGHEVTLYEMPQFRENIDPILQSGGIMLSGVGRTGFAKIDKVTTDIAEAVRGAPIIMAALVGLAYETVAELCAPYLEDGQTIVLSAGSLASLEFNRVLREKRPDLRVTLAETLNAPYGSRRGALGKAEVTIFSHTPPSIALAALPAKHTELVMKQMGEFYPGLYVAGENVVEVGLANIATLLPGPCLLMTGRIELPRSSDLFYSKFTPSIWKVVEATIRERNAILKVLGLRELYPFEKVKELFTEPGVQKLAGPSSMRHKFITESCPMGLVAWVSLGDLANVPMPVCKAIVTLISQIIGVDYFKEGRNLECLGISGFSIQQLRRFLAEGL